MPLSVIRTLRAASCHQRQIRARGGALLCPHFCETDHDSKLLLSVAKSHERPLSYSLVDLAALP
jgi:hypothetical protein